VFNIRMVLEVNGQVVPLHFSRFENGVAYFQRADGTGQCAQERPAQEPLEAAGDPLALTRTLSPGAETGEEVAQPDDARARAEPPRAPDTGARAPQRRAQAKARPRR
jgi:hypothetical protein